MGYAAQVTVMLSDTSCCTCGIQFAVPDRWLAGKRASGAGFYCPNGHDLVFGQTTEKKLRAELERKERALEMERNRREAAERQASAARGQVTKLKNRVNAGVCPHCNRTFQQLARHMKSKHAEQCIGMASAKGEG